MTKITAGGADRVLSRPQSLLKRGFSAALSVVLAASLCGVAPATAYASQSDAIDQLDSAIQDGSINQSFNYASDTAAAASNSYELATRYSLLNPSNPNAAITNSEGKLLSAADDSLVTPVKLQGPWGSCWSFASIAASETSILSRAQKEGKGSEYSSSTFDLSELQVVLSSMRKDGAPAQYVGEDQAGEGYHNGSSNPNYALNNGGIMTYASSIFASGIGPLYESRAKYQNSEQLEQCTVTYENGQVKTEYLTKSEVTAKKASADVISVLELSWAGNYKKENGETVHTTWSVSDSLWNSSDFEFENSNILPNTQVLDKDGNFQGINQKSINNIKDELQMQNRAVSCAFFADVSMPNQAGVAKYMDTKTWAHFTYENAGANHAVTIVGWDDDYPASRFGNAAGIQPEGNGAWLVKNSWGSETEEFPNGPGKGWGLENEEGKHTGYFWLSYYDRTLCALETFDFDLSSYSDSDTYVVDQYDYLPQTATYQIPSSTPTSSANVFTAEEDMSIRTLSCLVAKPNTTVTYELYLLDSDDESISPTDPDHSKKVLECQELYQYGGYHRVSLGGTDGNNWIGVRKGQRYAVVTTQYCNDDNKYYLCPGINTGKEYVEKEAASEATQNAWKASAKQSIYREYYSDLYNEYIIEPGATKESADKNAEDAANAKLETDEGKAAIEKLYEQTKSDFENVYFVAKVNEGESWTNWSELGSGDSSDVTWYDWTSFTVPAEKKTGYAIDNFSIKAYAELNEWATADEIDELAAAIAAAEAKLNAAKISADGSDVSAADTWMTQEQHDALAAAIDSAKKLLEAAGDYKSATAVAVLTPEQVGDSIASLAFDEQHGTKAAVVPASDPADQQGGPADGSKTHSAKTADTSAAATGALACLVAAAGAAAAVARRRQRG